MIDFIIRFIFITVLLIILLGAAAVPTLLMQAGHPTLGFLSISFFIASLITISECLFW